MKFRMDNALVVDGSFSSESWRMLANQAVMKALAHSASCKKKAIVAMLASQRVVAARTTSSWLAGYNATSATIHQRTARKALTTASSKRVVVPAAHRAMLRITTGNRNLARATVPTIHSAARAHASTSLPANVISRTSCIVDGYSVKNEKYPAFHDQWNIAEYY